MWYQYVTSYPMNKATKEGNVGDTKHRHTMMKTVISIHVS